jgi:PAS domain S-box-containing protein
MSSTTDTESKLRHRLYELIDDPDQSIAEKQHRALELGCEFLGVGNAYIQRCNADSSVDEIVAGVGSDPGLLSTGTAVEQQTSYCRRTVEASSPVALSNVPEQGWSEDPAYLEHGLACYLGTTIFVRGEVYGTVCFADHEARDAEFDAGEKAFVELIARLLGRELEANEHERRIETREQQRDELADKYETLLEGAPDAIFVTDEETGEIIRANRKAAELTGYEKAELTEMHLLSLHPTANRDRYRTLFDGATVTGRDRFDDETPLTIQRADGSEIDTEVSTSIVELGERTVRHCIVRDISQRRDREHELRVKNRAIEAASVGITIADATAEDLPLVYANTEFEQLTGYDSDEIEGENCRFLQGQATDEESLDRIRGALAAEQPVTTEILNYRANGSPFWNELTVAPVTERGSESVTHFVGFQQDITARKRQEQSLAVLDRVLRHNIRNEMSVISGFARVIAERTDGELAEMATRIVSSSEELTALTEKARELQLAMRAQEPLQPRDIVDDVEAVVSDLETEYPAVTFTVDASGSPQVAATERLRSALEEVGENAAKYGSSSVSVRIEDTETDRIAVHVSDTGPGLSEDEQKVVESGRETPLEHGDGLGLWLVNWIVTDLGGDVRTTVEDGTTVTLELPRARDQRPRYRGHRSTLRSVSE